jgi:hypothetical protein
MTDIFDDLKDLAQDVVSLHDRRINRKNRIAVKRARLPGRPTVIPDRQYIDAMMTLPVKIALLIMRHRRNADRI